MLNEAHTGERRGTMPLRVLIARMRHEGCGGGAGKVELLTRIDGVSSRPVRRIVLRVWVTVAAADDLRRPVRRARGDHGRCCAASGRGSGRRGGWGRERPAGSICA
jgi:hypothetical protein